MPQLLDDAVVIRFVGQAKMIEESILDLEPATPIALNTKDLAVDDASDLRPALTERANPELLPQFQPKLAHGFRRRPILLNADLKARKSGVRRMIRESGHPCAVSQLANLHDLHGIGDVQLPEDVHSQTP